LVEQGAMLIDVREPNEWQSFHAPNATLIPLGELSSHVSSLPKDRPIVVVCHSGNRSRQAQNTLLKAGFTDVINLSGGMVSWQQSGLPTVSGQ
jgi:rhodanese-related sulfurtransferase